MTINTNTLIQESTLNRMVQLAFRGQNQDPVLLDSALGVLKKCNFNAEQTAVIAAILGNGPSDNAIQATTAMKERILAVLRGEDIEINEVLEVTPNGQVPVESATQMIPMNQKSFVCISNAQTTGCMYQFHDDLVSTLFFQCQSTCEWESIGALACMSKYYNLCAAAYWKQFDLKLFCPELTILDAKTQGITVNDEPCISKLRILKSYIDLAPHVENNEGLTLLTMAKGLTLRQLVAIAAKEGMNVNFSWMQILQELGDVPVEQTYVILITNSVFEGSRNKSYAQHKECAAGQGCELPIVQEYVALCVFTNECFQKCLYGQTPWTYGRSSTHVGGNSLVVGGSSPARLYVDGFDFDGEIRGAGGQRKF